LATHCQKFGYRKRNDNKSLHGSTYLAAIFLSLEAVYDWLLADEQTDESIRTQVRLPIRLEESSGAC